MRIEVNSGIYLDEFRTSDRELLIAHLRQKEIYDQTLRIPFPYTPKDADDWIEHVAEVTRTNGRPLNWAIRSKPSAEIIGSIGFVDYAPGSHRAEIGYWLAKPFWKKGIMTATVQKFTQTSIEKFNLIRVTATTLETNIGSTRVLEKAGFQFEGLHRNHYLKNGKVMNGKLYSFIASFPVHNQTG